MKYLHVMVRVRDLEKSLAFYRDALGLVENRRKDYPDGRLLWSISAPPQEPWVSMQNTGKW